MNYRVIFARWATLASLATLRLAAQTVPPPPPTEDAAQVLSPFVVDATRESGYQATTTTVGKIPQQPRDIPQSLSIITEQLMQDRNATTVVEALRNVPGVTFNAGEGGRNGDNITIRGFSAVGDLYLDTIRDVAQYNRDTFNLSEIDVLRGAASMLFGRGSTGGVVNQVSKVPYLMNQSTAAVTVGMYDYVRVTADVNNIVGKDAALRINAMATARSDRVVQAAFLESGRLAATGTVADRLRPRVVRPGRLQAPA
jgi:catecholate siderophore receptor